MPGRERFLHCAITMWLVLTYIGPLSGLVTRWWMPYFPPRFEVYLVMLSKRQIKRLAHEVKAALAQQDRRGQSKHVAKQAARQYAQDRQTKYTPVTGLYATSSYTTYTKQALTALRWIAERHGCKHIAECRPYLREYYEDMCARNISAWTIHTRVYALCSVFSTSYKELLGVDKLPARCRADITRSRDIGGSADRYHAQHHEDARLLARACGARRGGLLGLCSDDMRIDENGALRIHLREKGGKERDALVLPQYADRVREVFSRYGDGAGAVTGGKRRLLPLQALPKDMPLHYLRARYANDLYSYYEGQGVASGKLYHCRKERAGQVYDKELLMAVSRNLGHSRCDVVVSHYLYMR